MSIIKTLLLDDEPLALKSLQSLLLGYCPDIEIVAMCQDLEEAVLKIVQLKPDLVILDIQLKEGTSFELLKRLPELDFEIIFVTAFSQYAIKAIKFNALDYLLKPLDLDELKAAIKRVKIRLMSPKPNRSLEVFLQNNTRSNPEKRITLPTNEALEFIEIKDILRCKADGSYTEFYTSSDKIIVSRNLKTYDQLLIDFDFFRPHQSHLVNRKYISKFIKSGGGLIIMTDGAEIPVSKRRRALFLEWINS